MLQFSFPSEHFLFHCYTALITLHQIDIRTTNGQKTLLNFRIIFYYARFKFYYIHVCVSMPACMCAFFYYLSLFLRRVKTAYAFVVLCFVNFLVLLFILSPKHRFRRLPVFSAFVQGFRCFIVVCHTRFNYVDSKLLGKKVINKWCHKCRKNEPLFNTISFILGINNFFLCIETTTNWSQEIKNHICIFSTLIITYIYMYIYTFFFTLILFHVLIFNCAIFLALKNRLDQRIWADQN